jgi:WD40 repeat protein
VWSVDYHFSGDFLISGSMDQSAKLWDLNTQKCKFSYRGHVDSVNTVKWKPYTNYFISASADKSISLWDIRSNLCVQTFNGHNNAVNCVAFNLLVLN